MNEFAEKNVTTKILGAEYKVKELSLAQKIKIFGGVSEFIRDIAKNAFFKKNDNGNIVFNFIILFFPGKSLLEAATVSSLKTKKIWSSSKSVIHYGMNHYKMPVRKML